MRFVTYLFLLYQLIFIFPHIMMFKQYIFSVSCLALGKTQNDCVFDNSNKISHAHLFPTVDCLLCSQQSTVLLHLSLIPSRVLDLLPTTKKKYRRNCINFHEFSWKVGLLRWTRYNERKSKGNALHTWNNISSFF